MQDRELYRQILGIEAPWFVERVELKLNQGEVHIYLEHGEMASWPCPECETSCHMERAVERGLERRQAEPLPQLGVDEKAFRKGHKYFTLVNDLERSRVLYVAEDRTQARLDGFWETLTEGQR